MASTNGVSVVISPPNFDLDSYKLLNFNESFEQLFDRACDNILSDQANLEASTSEDAVTESFSVTSSDGVADEPDTAAVSASKQSHYVYVSSPRKIKHTYGKKGVANRTITMIDFLSDDEDVITQKARKPSQSNVDNFAGTEAPLVDMDNSALSGDHASETTSSDIDVVDTVENGSAASLVPSNRDRLIQCEDQPSESCVRNFAEPEGIKTKSTGFLDGSTDDALNGDVKDEEATEGNAFWAGPASPPSFVSMATAAPQAQPSATALSWQKKINGPFGKKTPKESVLAAPSEFFNQNGLMKSEGEGEGEDEVNQQPDEPDESASNASSERKFVDFEALTMDNAGLSNSHTDDALNGDFKDETMEEDAIFASLELSRREELMQSIVSHRFMQKGGYPVVRSERCEFIDYISTEAMRAGMDEMAIYLLIRYVRKLYLGMNSSLSEADIDVLEGFEFGDERRKKRKRKPDRGRKNSKRKKRLLDNEDTAELVVSQMPSVEGNGVDAEDDHVDYMNDRHDSLPEVEAPDHHSSSKAKRNKRKRERQKKKKAEKHRESLSKATLREGAPPAQEAKMSTPKKTPSKSPGSSRKSSHDELPADPGLWDVDF